MTQSTLFRASSSFALALLLTLPSRSFSQAKPPIEDPTAVVTLTGVKEIVRSETFQQNEDWLPIHWESVRTAKGSALDFSGFADAPAGNHGEVICQDGQFVFKNEPKKPLHFYGVTVTHGLPYIDKDKSEQLASYLASCGYNIVRFHTYTFVEGVLKEEGSPEFTPEKLDQLEYFISCLRKRGIYYTLPLNMGTRLKAGQIKDIAEFSTRPLRFELSGLLPISQEAQSWFKQFSQNLLCHKNPYTGVAMKDDPAMISVEINNENGIFKIFEETPDLIPVYRQKCREYLLSQSKTEPTPEQVEKFLPQFVALKQDQYYQTMKEFLRGIGVNKPLTDISNRVNLIYSIPRSHFDYVDTHNYWALYKRLPGEKPNAKGEVVYRVKGLNPNATGWDGILLAIPGRIFGLPFACGEFNSCYPTPYWTFTAPTEAALASLQGWNVLIRCGLLPFPEQMFNPTRIRTIETAANPVMMFSERIGSLIFAQHEMAPLPVKLPFIVTPEYLYETLDLKGGPRYPNFYSALGFQYQIGTILLDGKENLDGYPCLVAPTDMKLPASLANKKVLRADATLAAKLKELFPKNTSAPAWELDTKKGTARNVTARSETFTLPATVDAMDGKIVNIAGNKTVATCFAGSVDGQPLATSNRILAMYLTDVKNNNCKIDYEKDGAMILRNFGTLPLLIRQGKIQMTFKIAGRPLPKVWALKYDGSRAVEVTAKKTETGFAFEAQALTNAETFSLYEIAWDAH